MLIQNHSKIHISMKVCLLSNANSNLTNKLYLELYPTLPPIEKFMNIPALQAKSHFFNYLEVGDIVIGNITSVSDRGIYVQLVCFDSITMKKREMEYLKIIVNYF